MRRRRDDRACGGQRGHGARARRLRRAAAPQPNTDNGRLQRGGQPGTRRSTRPPTRAGRIIVRQQQRPGLHRPGQHLLRVQVELHPAVRDAADDLQVLPGHVRPAARPRPRDGARHVASSDGLTWTYHIKPNVKFEDGTPVTSADVKYAVERTFDQGRPAQRAELLRRSCWPRNAASTRAPTRTGQEPMDLTAVDHAGRDHDRVPPGEAVRRLQLRGRDPADRPGAAGQGHRRELPAAPDLHRPVHVPELPAQQAVHAGAEPELEPGHQPAGQAAGQQDRRQT